MKLRLAALVGAALLPLGLTGCFAGPTTTVTVTERVTVTAGPGDSTGATQAPTSAPASTAAPDGIRPCVLDSLPDEVAEAVDVVKSNGPYLRPRDDGDVFGNREGLLPSKPRGYYREYTVEAPGERFPGPRRIVTGGQERPGAAVDEWFYSGDHYRSFCFVTQVR